MTDSALPTLSIFLTTTSRPTLARTLKSIRSQEFVPGDEILLVCDGPQPAAVALWNQFSLPGRVILVPDGPHGDWGHFARNSTKGEAKGDWVMAFDDDDCYLPGAFTRIRQVLARNPTRPHLFRMVNHPAVGTVWKDPVVREANVGTPMFAAPNDPSRLGNYGYRYVGDFDFINHTCGYYPEGPVWSTEEICTVRPWR